MTKLVTTALVFATLLTGYNNVHGGLGIGNDPSSSKDNKQIISSVTPTELSDIVKEKFAKYDGPAFTVTKPGNILLNDRRFDNVDISGGIIYLRVAPDTTKIPTRYKDGGLLVKSEDSRSDSVVSELELKNPRYFFVKCNAGTSIDSAVNALRNGVRDVRLYKRRTEPINQNLGIYPNPFNPSTIIEFNIPVDGHVHISVYDIMGKEVLRVADGTVNRGVAKYTANMDVYPSGVYFVRGQISGLSSDYVAVKKILKIK